MVCSDPASEVEAIQGSEYLGSLRNKIGTSLYITNTKLSLGRNGLFPTDALQNSKLSIVLSSTN